MRQSFQPKKLRNSLVKFILPNLMNFTLGTRRKCTINWEFNKEGTGLDRYVQKFTICIILKCHRRCMLGNSSYQWNHNLKCLMQNTNVYLNKNRNTRLCNNPRYVKGQEIFKACIQYCGLLLWQ